jgi:transposase
MNLVLGTPLRLMHLPVLMDVIRRMGILNVIDFSVRDDSRSKVSTSECVAILLCSIYAGAHDLWRIRERLSRYDMKTIMNDSMFNISEFPEERLAKMLDDLWKADVHKLMTALSILMIERFSLKTEVLHFDTTSLTFFGAYEREDFASVTSEMPAAPLITYGYSKDHRPDLKQILFGSLVTADGGVPLMGHALDGNSSDNVSTADFFTEVRQLVADPRKVCCVADSKGWCSRVLSVISEQDMRLLSRLPRSQNLHRELMEKPWLPTGTLQIPRKGSKKSPKSPDELHWMAFDTHDVYDRESPADTPDGKPITKSFVIPVRALRVWSSALLRTKVATAQRELSREKTRAKKMIAAAQSEAYACERDALHAVAILREKNKFTAYDVHAVVVRYATPFKAGPGRPRSVPRPPITKKHHYRLTITITDVDEKTLTQRLHHAASYILIRTKNTDWDISDIDMIQQYKGQYHNEHGFSWLKSGMRLNPVFLKTPHRIGSLCFIYCLGLMIWSLIQRNVRAYLIANKAGLPYHRGKSSNHITTRFFFELFAQVQTIPVTTANGTTQTQLAGFNDTIAKACAAIGTNRNVFNPVQDRNN